MKRVAVEISVKFSAGAHVTNTVRGVRASSTASAQQAADAFGRKFFGKGLRGVRELPGNEPCACRFIVTGTNADPKGSPRAKR